MIKKIKIERDYIEDEERDVWFVYAEGALFAVEYFKTDVMRAVSKLLAKEDE